MSAFIKHFFSVFSLVFVVDSIGSETLNCVAFIVKKTTAAVANSFFLQNIDTKINA